MTITTDDIGKLVRIGDCEIGSVVSRRGAQRRVEPPDIDGFLADVQATLVSLPNRDSSGRWLRSPCANHIATMPGCVYCELLDRKVTSEPNGSPAT